MLVFFAKIRTLAVWRALRRRFSLRRFPYSVICYVGGEKLRLIAQSASPAASCILERAELNELRPNNARQGQAAIDIRGGSLSLNALAVNEAVPQPIDRPGLLTAGDSRTIGTVA